VSTGGYIVDRCLRLRAVLCDVHRRSSENGKLLFSPKSSSWEVFTLYSPGKLACSVDDHIDVYAEQPRCNWRANTNRIVVSGQTLIDTSEGTGAMLRGRTCQLFDVAAYDYLRLSRWRVTVAEGIAADHVDGRFQSISQNARFQTSFYFIKGYLFV